MGHEKNIWVVGGDMRQAKLAGLLADDGHTVHTYALEIANEEQVQIQPDLLGIRRADCVILPLPALGEPGYLNTPLSTRRIPIGPLLDAMRPGQLLCAGKVEDILVSEAQARGLHLIDYFAREELVIANAVPTVEGAVQIAMEELAITLHTARVLVLGFGRLGKLSAHRLHGLGAKITVAARTWEDLAWAQAYGYDTQHLGDLDGWMCGYELIINTIPHKVLTSSRLSDLRPGCLIIDLASKPGGVDMSAAQRLGVRVVWALSLPGKVAPVTSGRMIRDTVYHILAELEG